MTRSEREQQILRYLRGDMTSTEEESFFIQVALDRELRDELKAQRAIEGSIRGFRDVERTQQHTRLRARTAAMLAGYPASQVGATVASGAAAPANISGQGTGMPVRWIVTAMVTVGLTVALFFALPGQDQPVTPAVAQPAPQSMPGTTSEWHSSPAQTPVDLPRSRQHGVTGMEQPAATVTADQPAARERSTRVVSPRPNRSQPPHLSQASGSVEDRSLPQRRDNPEPRRSQKGKDSLKVGVDVQIEMQK
jgi:hypothetical protein